VPTGGNASTDSPGALPPVVVQGDATSSGATITFQEIGAAGWYPSRRDPSSGMCDAVNDGACCMTTHEITRDALTPWNEELIMQLRAPLLLERYAVYQPVQDAAGAEWGRSSVWDKSGAVPTDNLVFGADGVEGQGIDGAFDGTVGSTCVLDVMAESTVPCGSGSLPYCEGEAKHEGWSGSKLFVLLASMPHVGDPAASGISNCAGSDDNWFDAPWIGLTHGELVRSGKFGSCHCYAKNPAEWYLADGCGQFNVWEVVNDNNEFANLDLFSTNLFAYHGYVGEGPCGNNCNVSSLPASVDLVDKATSGAAAVGATATPSGGPGAAFRRPASGYRYFFVLLDTASRTIQMGMLHPDGIPAAVDGLLPGLPERVGESEVHALRDLRLPM
jgi:hypothetical protein